MRWELLVGGWREVSLVDVLEHVSFTVWLAWCNLRCPWCSNADLARGRGARRVSVGELVEMARRARGFVDVFHVTGGEPLLQWRVLKELFRSLRSEVGLPLSLDTNGTLPQALAEVVPDLYHLAIDVKAPPSDAELYARVTGVSVGLARALAGRVVESIGVSLRVPFLELRTTLVPGLLKREDVVRAAREVERLVEGARGRVVYVVQQFIPYEGVAGPYSSRPATPAEEVRRCAEEVASLTGLEVYYRTLEDGARRASPRPGTR